MRGYVAALLGIAAVTSLEACEVRNLQTIGLPPLLQGLVAHWTCDESGGEVLHDTSGKSHDGQITGGGTFTAGRFGNALSLERGQYVTVMNFPYATSSWTVSAWTKIPSGVTGDVCLMSTELAGVGGWALRANIGAQTCNFRYRVGSDNDGVDTYVNHDSHGLSATDRIIHVAVVVDGDGQAMTLTPYVDGSIRDSVIPIPKTISPGLSDLLIGRSGLAVEDFAGLIDDIAIYSRALSPEEVLRLHNEAAPNFTALPVTLPPDSVDAGSESPDASVSRD